MRGVWWNVSSGCQAPGQDLRVIGAPLQERRESSAAERVTPERASSGPGETLAVLRPAGGSDVCHSQVDRGYYGE